MSLKNQSNFYGVRAVQEKYSSNNKYPASRKSYTIPENENFAYLEETSVSCDCDSDDTPTYNYQQQNNYSYGNQIMAKGICPQPTPCPQPAPPCPCPPTPPCPPPAPPCPCPPTPPCPPPTPPCPCSTCGSSCGCSCKNNNSCGCDEEYKSCDECGPANNCCKGLKCQFDPCQAKCVCTYMNVLYDEKIASGSTVFNTLTATTPNYIITTELTPLSINSGGCCSCNCGSTCSIDSTSTFTIESVNTTIKSFALDGTTLSTSSILIGGKQPLSVTQTSNGYSAVVDPSVLNETCTCNSRGTKSNVIIQGLSGWDYFAKYVICGKVSTNGSTCRFKMVVENSSIPDVIESSLTFASPELCLPSPENSNPVILDIKFGANGQLVNPVISAIGGPSPLPVTLTITGNVMLSTAADVYVTKQSKVCIQGNVIQN